MAEAINTLNYMIGAAWTGRKATQDAKADITGMGKAGETSTQQLKGTETAASKFGSTLRSLVGAGVILGVGKQLLDFGKASIAAASSVEEMQSKFNTVFRDEAPRVTAALDDFAAAANRSKTTLMGYAATLQDTFVPLGFARDQAADMSIQLVKLAEDLGSFNDIDTETVVRDLQSALVGNTETLRKYGVVAQETQIKQEALNTGLWDGKGVIDAQAKAQAILQLTLKGTTDAQGDAIKTADSYANVQRGLEAATLDLKVAVGQGLMPTMTSLTMVATELVRQLNIAAKGFSGEFAQGVNDADEAGQAQVNTFDEMASRLARVNEAYELSRSLLGRFTGTQDEARESLRGAIEMLALSSGSYEEFEAAAKAAGLTTAEVANILNLFETDLHGNTQAWYAVATAANTAATADQLFANYSRDTALAISAETAEMGAWEARAAISVELYGQLYEKTEAATRGIGGFTGAITDGLTPLEELNTALGEQDAKMTAVAQNAAYEETLTRMGENTDIQAAKVENLTAKILGIPPEYGSRIDVDTSAAEAKIQRLKDLLGSLGAARAMAPELGEGDIGGSVMGGFSMRYASGGLVNPGLGSPGRDSILAALAPGEEILRRDDPRHVLNSGGSTSITLDLRGAVVASQQQLTGWIQGAMAQAGRQADIRIRT